MKKTKKVLAVLSALSLMLTSANIALTAAAEEKVTTLELGANGQAWVNEGTAASADYGRAELWEGGELAAAQPADKNYKTNWTSNQSKTVKFYPKLDAGFYTVSVWVPAEGYQVPVLMSTSTGINKLENTQLTDGMYWGVAGPGAYVEYGTFLFNGEYGTDCVELTECLRTQGNTGWSVNYGPVKFKKVETANGSDVETLILEENGQALVNGETSYYTNNEYGTTVVTGAANTSTGSQFHGDSAYSFSAANSGASYVTYYPVLSAGKYKVSVYVPKGGYQSGLMATGSDGTVGQDYYKVSVTEGYFQDMGVFRFTGEFGKDFLKLSEKTIDGVHAGWSQICDAVKFEKIDDRIGQWDFNTEENTDAVGKYTLNVTAGDSIACDEYGFKGSGRRIIRPTLENDESNETNNTFKVSVPSDLKGNKQLTVNVWVRNEGAAWYQNIVEIFQNNPTEAKKYRLANARMANSALETHVRSWIGDTGEGESRDNGTPLLASDGWHMITVTFTANTDTWNDGAISLRTYCDGVHVGGADMNNANGMWENTLQDYTEIYIGADHNGNHRFNGVIDELTVYSTALTQDEIKSLYNGESRAPISLMDDNIAMSEPTEIGSNNSIIISASNMPNSNTDYTAAATADGVFNNDILYINNIPTGLYVSNVKVEYGMMIVTFAGSADEPVKDDRQIGVAIKAYGAYTANSDMIKAVLKTSYEMKLSDVSMADGVCTVKLVNNSYAGATVDVVVAVYNSDDTMKDVYLQKEIAVPNAGETITVTTDLLNYADGNTIKVFVFDSIGTIKPIKLAK